MKRIIIVGILCIFSITYLFAQKDESNQEIRLLVRGDDIGFSHAANVGCIESYRYGIMRSVELMVPVPWFLEAVKMLNDNPGLDVGVHLAITSEWQELKWRPLTNVPGLVDSNGYFYPMVWPNENFPLHASLHGADWKIEEIEQELRAQIEMALRHVPHTTHLGGHMGFASLDPKIAELMDKLRKEYDLEIDMSRDKMKRFEGWGDAETLKQRINYFAKNLEKLEPGTYIFVDHPAKDTPEMRSVFHKGYENVAEDRDWVTKVFTSKKVKKVIKKKGIKLISYKDLKE